MYSIFLNFFLQFHYSRIFPACKALKRIFFYFFYKKKQGLTAMPCLLIMTPTPVGVFN